MRVSALPEPVWMLPGIQMGTRILWNYFATSELKTRTKVRTFRRGFGQTRVPNGSPSLGTVSTPPFEAA